MNDSLGGYLVSGANGNHLPTEKNGKFDPRLAGDAWAALHGGWRGHKYEGPGKEEAIAKLKRLYHEHGLTPPDESKNRAGRASTDEHFVLVNRVPRSRAGWIHIVPKGELPHKSSGITQVVDDEALDSIWNRLQQLQSNPNWEGLYAGREHFIYDDDKDSEALGWFKTFDRDDDGIWAKDDGLTDIGRDAIRNKRYKFTSMVVNHGDMQPVGTGAADGIKRFRPLAIDTVGFTNIPNARHLLAPISNRTPTIREEVSVSAPPVRERVPNRAPTVRERVSNTTPTVRERVSDSAPPPRLPGLENFPGASAPGTNQNTDGGISQRLVASSPPKPKRKRMNSVLTELGLSPDASEESALAAVHKLKNRIKDLEPLSEENSRLKNRVGELDTQNVDSLLASRGIKDEKVLNRLKPVLAKMETVADRVGFLDDCGYQAGTTGGGAGPAGRQVKLFNRETTAPAALKFGAEAKEDGADAEKIMNRAREIKKENKTVTMATAVAMARRELSRG